ncbi:hypothetical protein GCM10009733_031150 [Nonomuraea maheshkhaliensis]|uniref:Transposase n=1 Tax=Nonomuraea maheshkhaliensis TaxID=419590 RepID=A0ABN2F5S5_9ACTN
MALPSIPTTWAPGADVQNPSIGNVTGEARLDRRPAGAPAPTDLRDIFNAILYLNRTGVTWAYLPHDFPPHGTVYSSYAARRDEGIFAQPNYDLTGLARVKQGRDPQPTAAVIDTQTITTSTNPPTASQGTDAAKKIAEVVHRGPETRGFHVLERRWVIERTFGRLMLHRRLARAYETLPASSEAVIHIAVIDNAGKRITDESTPTWRGTY